MKIERWVIKKRRTVVCGRGNETGKWDGKKRRTAKGCLKRVAIDEDGEEQKRIVEQIERWVIQG